MSHTCPKCSREFRSPRGLVQHLESCMGVSGVYNGVSMWESSRGQRNLFTNNNCDSDDENGNIIATSESWNSYRQRFECSLCSKEFTSLGGLQGHLNSGVHDSSRRYKCNTCDREFKRMSHLRQHQETSKTNCKSQERLGNLLVHDFERLASNPRLLLTNGANWVENPECKLYFDGGSRGNPGNAASAYVLYDHRGHMMHQAVVEIPYRASNNEAEYLGMIHGLQAAIARCVRDIVIYGDSEVVIKQMNGDYNVNSDRMLPLYNKSNSLLSEFRRHSCKWIPRAENTVADGLAREYLNGDSDYDEVAGFHR